MNIILGHIRIHHSRMRGINQNLGDLRSDMSREIAGVEDRGEFGSTILAIGAGVGVDFCEAGKGRRFFGGEFVCVGGLEGNVDLVACCGGGFEEGDFLFFEGGGILSVGKVACFFIID